MNVRIQIIIGVIVLGALIVIVNMIRQKKLELRYALAWMAVGLGILTTRIAGKMGVASPVNLLFFGGFCFSLVIIFVLTIAVSRASIRIKQLTQELALFEKKYTEEHENNDEYRG